MSPARKATSARSGASSKATKSTAKRSTVKKATAATARAKKTAARKKPPAKRTTAKKTAAKKTTAKKAVAKKAATRKKTPAKKTTPRKTEAKKTPGKPPQTLTRPVPPKRRVRAAKLTPDQLKKIRATLEEKKGELEERQRELEESSFDSTQSDITGEVGIDEDFADAGTATFERERDLSIRNNIRDLVDQVTRAMRRIDDGQYGTCERCGNPIDATRLRELPHASLCLDCKRREERAR